MSIDSILIFLAMLFCLVTVHELGHFLFAKLVGMRVDEFAFGFPPRLFSWKKGETEYSVNLIPLGGYVKIFGENGLTHEEKQSLSVDESRRMFGNKKIWERILVLLGGVLFNIFAAILIFTGVLVSGTKLYLSDEVLENFVGKKELLIVNIDARSPLYGSEIKEGSKIIAIESQGNKILEDEQASKWNRNILRQFVLENNNSEINIYYTLPGSEIIKSVSAIPKAGIVPDKKVLGVEFADIGFRKLNLIEAFREAIKITYTQTLGIFIGLYDLLKKVVSNEAKISDNLAGPIGLAVVTSKVSERGLDQFAMFAALISLSLAVFNILPLPALDGGRILFVVVEAITRKKVKGEVEQVVHALGFVFLLGLMLFVSYYDIVKALAA